MKKYLGVVYIVGVLLTLTYLLAGATYTPKNIDISSAPPKSSVKNQNLNNSQAIASEENNPKYNSPEPQAQARTTNAERTPKSVIVADGKIYPNRVYKTMITPNDPLYNQWWIAPNNMTNVWDIPAGSYTPKVAIIDTGFALKHLDLAGRWAINTGESGPTSNESPSLKNCTDQSKPLDKSCNLIDDDYDGIVDNESGPTTIENPSDLNCTDQSKPLDKSCNNIDDDNNNYKDDITGWDFADNDPSVQAGEINPTGSGTTHGTMTSGVFGASGNNSVGIAGVNWQAKILPIEALDDDGYGDSFTVGQSVYYAANQGADIISISLGTNADDPYMRSAILYALDHGSMVVAASGNNGCDCISYPANYPEVLAVGAINSTGAPASFSNYGANLDLLAPGQSITTTTFTSTNQTNAYASNVAGTSFSTPFAAGLLAYGKSLQPNAKWEEIIGLMLENSDRRTLTNLVPRSNSLGFGVTLADTMLARLQNPRSYTQRVQLDDTSTGSNNNFQCDQNQIPATNFYELSKSSQYLYTSSQRKLSYYAQNGWSTKQIGYSCMGISADSITSLRILNLPSELHNLFIKQ